MKITVVPASTKTSTAAIRSLLSTYTVPIEINAIYRDPAKAPAEFTSHVNFKAIKGDIQDRASLDFDGSDVVLTMTPPVFDGGDPPPVERAEVVSRNVKDAIERAGSVKKLVYVSSVGAQFDAGVGEIRTNNKAEIVFAKTNVAEIIFVRCAYFMENWTASLETLKSSQPFFFSTITPLNWKIPMVAVKDIGITLASEVLKTTPSPRNPHTFELNGPRQYSPLDVQAAFSKALGKDVTVKAVERSELQGFFSAVFPAAIVDLWVEMALSFLEGGVMDARNEEKSKKDVVNGKTGLDEIVQGIVGCI